MLLLLLQTLCAQGARPSHASGKSVTYSSFLSKNLDLYFIPDHSTDPKPTPLVGEIIPMDPLALYRKVYQPLYFTLMIPRAPLGSKAALTTVLLQHKEGSFKDDGSFDDDHSFCFIGKGTEVRYQDKASMFFRILVLPVDLAARLSKFSMLNILKHISTKVSCFAAMRLFKQYEVICTILFFMSSSSDAAYDFFEENKILILKAAQALLQADDPFFALPQIAPLLERQSKIEADIQDAISSSILD